MNKNSVNIGMMYILVCKQRYSLSYFYNNASWCKITFRTVLFVNSWSRWADIQRHGHFKHKLEIADIRTIARAMVSSCSTP